MSDARAHTGRVIANYGARLLVRDDKGHLHRCAALRKLGLIVSGDLVEWQPQSSGDARVTSVFARQTLLQRPDRRGQLKPVAANLKQLAIVSAIKPGVETLLIDQYAAAAELAGIEPVIVVNKSDLLDEPARREMQAMLSVYQQIGYRTAMIDCKSDAGIRPLQRLLRDQISMLVGQSGVGKSSIVQKLFPDLEIQVGALSEASGSGAHTTTVTSWYDLPGGGALIDSPGVRQFSLEHLTQQDLARGFRDIRELAGNCRFHNCTHLHEPDCAVRRALADGRLADWRYGNYCKLSEPPQD
ncbi:ribosome small subunit-dependent GTPase A [Granulosicoccaceae sp. 1_MG-2023]|nr:ribosome small subunit-dependent GTPase A [Granulosicoccaceae sp. 1_MG-2023]